MDSKSSSRCLRPSDFSVAFLMSTIGVRPRGSKCTQTIPSFKSCIRSADPIQDSTPLQEFQQPHGGAYTALGDAVPASSGSGGHCQLADEVHQGGEVALSCRLCLIACNSRKFTFVQALFLPSVPEEGFSGDR